MELNERCLGEDMKIGILTYHRSINYGAVMQAYALARRLQEVPGVQVEVIDYMSARMDKYYKMFTVYRGRNGISKIKNRFEMYSAFQSGISQLPLSNERLISDDQNRFNRYIANKYDMIVVGSDAVWNYEKRGLPNPYFLIGADNVRKVSYAASCNGIKYDQVDDEKLRILTDAFSDFEYIGVRDELTRKLVGKAIGKDISHHNCDPTFLLDFQKDGLDDNFRGELLKKLVEKYHWDVKKRHIGLMLSNLNGDLSRKLVDELKNRYGKNYQIVSLYSYCKYADIPYISDLTPFEWSRIFSLFDITFSKYFHGTLLSILNETPVISLSAEIEAAGIPAKVEDVLSRLALMEFYCPARKASDIDWDQFLCKVDRLICEPPKERMRESVSRERLCANSFFEYISK